MCEKFSLKGRGGAQPSSQHLSCVALCPHIEWGGLPLVFRVWGGSPGSPEFINLEVGVENQTEGLGTNCVSESLI